jgi:hypothetical protein
MNVPKKSITYHFHNEWEIEYFFGMAKDKFCFLFQMPQYPWQRKGDMEHHCDALHSTKYDADFPSRSEINS